MAKMNFRIEEKEKEAAGALLLKACAWGDGGAEFVFSDGTVLVCQDEMQTCVALSPTPLLSYENSSREFRNRPPPSSSSKDVFYMDWPLQQYRHNVHAALLLYNRFTAHPRITPFLLQSEKEREKKMEDEKEEENIHAHMTTRGGVTSWWSRLGKVEGVGGWGERRGGKATSPPCARKHPEELSLPSCGASHHNEEEGEEKGGGGLPHHHYISGRMHCSSSPPPPPIHPSFYYLSKSFSLLERRAVVVAAAAATTTTKAKKKRTTPITSCCQEEGVPVKETSSVPSYRDHDSLSPPLLFPVKGEEEVTLWCHHRRVSLTLHWHRQLFTVRWPLHLAEYEDEKRKKGISRENNNRNKQQDEEKEEEEEGTTTTATAASASSSNYFLMEQIFPVAAPPPEWRPMLSLLWAMMREIEKEDVNKKTMRSPAHWYSSSSSFFSSLPFTHSLPKEEWIAFPLPRRAQTSTSRSSSPQQHCPPSSSSSSSFHLPRFAPAEPHHRLLLLCATQLSLATCQGELHHHSDPLFLSSSRSALPPAPYLLWEWMSTSGASSSHPVHPRLRPSSSSRDVNAAAPRRSLGRDPHCWNSPTHPRGAVSQSPSPSSFITKRGGGGFLTESHEGGISYHNPIGVLLWFIPPFASSSSSSTSRPAPSHRLEEARKNERETGRGKYGREGNAHPVVEEDYDNNRHDTNKDAEKGKEVEEWEEEEQEAQQQLGEKGWVLVIQVNAKAGVYPPIRVYPLGSQGVSPPQQPFLHPDHHHGTKDDEEEEEEEENRSEEDEEESRRMEMRTKMEKEFEKDSPLPPLRRGGRTSSSRSSRNGAPPPSSSWFMIRLRRLGSSSGKVYITPQGGGLQSRLLPPQHWGRQLDTAEEEEGKKLGNDAEGSRLYASSAFPSSSSVLLHPGSTSRTAAAAGGGGWRLPAWALAAVGRPLSLSASFLLPFSVSSSSSSCTTYFDEGFAVHIEEENILMLFTLPYGGHPLPLPCEISPPHGEAALSPAASVYDPFMQWGAPKKMNGAVVVVEEKEDALLRQSHHSDEEEEEDHKKWGWSEGSWRTRRVRDLSEAVSRGILLLGEGPPEWRRWGSTPPQYCFAAAPGPGSRGGGGDPLLPPPPPLPPSSSSSSSSLVGGGSNSSLWSRATPTAALATTSSSGNPIRWKTAAYTNPTRQKVVVPPPMSHHHHHYTGVCPNTSSSNHENSGALTSVRVEGVGNFSAWCNGILRGHFDDQTILSLIPSHFYYPPQQPQHCPSSWSVWVREEEESLVLRGRIVMPDRAKNVGSGSARNVEIRLGFLLARLKETGVSDCVENQNRPFPTSGEYYYHYDHHSEEVENGLGEPFSCCSSSSYEVAMSYVEMLLQFRRRVVADLLLSFEEEKMKYYYY